MVHTGSVWFTQDVCEVHTGSVLDSHVLYVVHTESTGFKPDGFTTNVPGSHT